MSSWKPNPTIRRALSNGPRNFAMMALPIIEQLGEKGKKMIYDIVYNDGVKKGQRLAKLAKDPNDLVEFERILIEDFAKADFNTCGFDDPHRQWVVREKNKCSYTNCLSGGCEENIPQVWQEMGLDEATIRMLGEISCVPHDLGVRTGYNPKMKFKFKRLLPRGDECCEWYEELDE